LFIAGGGSVPNRANSFEVVYRNMGDLNAPVTQVTKTIKMLSSHINYKIGDTWKSNT